MPAPIAPVALPRTQLGRQATAATPTGAAAGEPGLGGRAEVESFGDRLLEVVQRADAAQKSAESAATEFSEGRSPDIHGTMIAMQRADITFRLATTIRNRVLEAYREVMRMGA